MNECDYLDRVADEVPEPRPRQILAAWMRDWNLRKITVTKLREGGAIYLLIENDRHACYERVSPEEFARAQSSELSAPALIARFEHRITVARRERAERAAGLRS